ncbi:uncharacterized protein METZ01_LOCUS93420, partial [marine metagenome]|jgi:hypothetical protein
VHYAAFFASDSVQKWGLASKCMAVGRFREDDFGTEIAEQASGKCSRETVR